ERKLPQRRPVQADLRRRLRRGRVVVVTERTLQLERLDQRDADLAEHRVGAAIGVDERLLDAADDETLLLQLVGDVRQRFLPPRTTDRPADVAGRETPWCRAAHAR